MALTRDSPDLPACSPNPAGLELKVKCVVPEIIVLTIASSFASSAIFAQFCGPIRLVLHRHRFGVPFERIALKMPTSRDSSPKADSGKTAAKETDLAATNMEDLERELKKHGRTAMSVLQEKVQELREDEAPKALGGISSHTL